MTQHQSVVWKESETRPGVSFGIRQVSFRRRTELLQKVRAVSGRQEFLAAGESLEEKLGAAVLEREIDELYLRWGLAGVRSLKIDGVEATTDLLLADGPEDLCGEILAQVKRECGLSEDEAKN